jgi:hypothetical protein
MKRRAEGLTTTYNRFHDPSDNSADISRLRVLHVEMDNATAAAYGWSDLDLEHGFQQMKQRVRYTLSEPASRAVLDRLLALNHQRYEDELKADLHQKKDKGNSISKGIKPAPVRRHGMSNHDAEADLFGREK